MLGMHFSKKSMLFQNKYRKLQNKYRKVTAWGYKFHALAVYLHPTFKIPSQSEAYLEPSRTSAMELQAANNFRKKAPSWMLGRVLNTPLSDNLLQLAEGLRSFPSLGLCKGILDLPYYLLFLINTKNNKNKPSTCPASKFS